MGRPRASASRGIHYLTGGIIIAVWAVLVEAVLAVVGDAPAWAPAEPARSCDAPSPRCSAATLGPSFLLSLEDPVHVLRRLPDQVREVRPITHDSAGLSELWKDLVNTRYLAWRLRLDAERRGEQA
jgi:hypothetical protein